MTTTTTRRPFGPARTEPAPRPPGKVRRAAARKREAAAKAAAPYVLTVGGALAVSGAADIALGVPAMPPLPSAVIGGALTLAGVKLWENHGWHRSGGKAAMRQRRKYQGTATRRELRQNLSPSAVAKRAAVTCPGLHPDEAHVLIGRAKGQDIAGSREDSYLLVAGPRFGKTALLACWAEDAPGSLLATSTRTDLYAHTVITRGGGDVRVLNPDGDGGIPSTLQWSPVSGCEDPAIAIQRAGYLMDAAPRDTSGKDAWWDDQSKTLLMYLLHAAALTGATILDVRRWASGVLADPAPLDALAVAGAAPGWADELFAMAERIRSDETYGGAVSTGIKTVLGWLSDPGMAVAACPAPGAGFDAETFLREGTGSVYLIGADRPHGPLGPYFAAFTANLFETAKRVASRSPGRRVPRTLTLALDEAAVTCPVPLHKWTSEAGGHGVTVMAAVQSVSQLHSRWGEYDGKTIFKNSTIKLFWGGDTSADDLKAISDVCGPRDTWDHSKADDGSRTRTPRQEPAVPPERIRMLGRNEVLVLHRSTRAVFARVTPVWDRPGYQPAVTGEPSAPSRPVLAAITSGRRDAIPMPPAPPQAVSGTEPVPELSGPAPAPDPIPDYAPDYEEAVTWHSPTATSA